MNLLTRMRALVRREKLDAEMSAEMRAHLELEAAENERRGMTPTEARYAAVGANPKWTESERRAILSQAIRRRDDPAESLTTIGLGVIVGIAGGAAATRFIAHLLYGLSPSDVSTYGLVAALLLGVGLLAGFLPARRAAKIDPCVALRRD